MAEFKYNRVLLWLILAGLAAALVIVGQRHSVEQANRQVEMVMDYEDLTELARIEGLPAADLLPQFRTAGITSLAVYETTLEKLGKTGQITTVSGARVLDSYRTGTLTDPQWRELVATGKIAGGDVYVTGPEGTTFDEVGADLARRLGVDRVSEISLGDHPVLALKADYEKVLKWNLGLSTAEMQEVARQGFYVIVRPTNYSRVQPDDVNAVFRRLNGIERLSGIMFSGDEVLGYPGLVSLTAAHMKDRGLPLDMIEHPLQLQFLKQDGLLPLATAVGYNAARVYVIPKDEQPKLKMADAVQRWWSTDEERNIRVNLLRRYDRPEPGKTLVETNLAYVTAVKQALLASGFTLGRAGAYQPYFPSPWLLAGVIMGAVAAGVLLLTLLRPFPAAGQYILVAVLTGVLAWPVLRGGGTLARQLVALACAISFPVLAMTWQLDRWRSRGPQPGSPLWRILRDGLGALTITVLLSLAGGLFVAAVLGDVRFLMEMEIFRGVKLTFVAPPLLFALIYLTRYNLFAGEDAAGPTGVGRQLLKMLDYPVYLKTLIVCAVAAAAAWIFIGRSGHTSGVPVPEFELKFRAALERLMYARPREKEFLIGHPAFLLSVMAFYRQWPRWLHFGLLIIATIGQGSLVETFAHIRTPVLMSAVRGIDGLIAGAVIGIIAVVGVQVLHYLSFMLERGPADNE